MTNNTSLNFPFPRLTRHGCEAEVDAEEEEEDEGELADLEGELNEDKT